MSALYYNFYHSNLSLRVSPIHPNRQRATTIKLILNILISFTGFHYRFPHTKVSPGWAKNMHANFKIKKTVPKFIDTVYMVILEFNQNFTPSESTI